MRSRRSSPENLASLLIEYDYKSIKLSFNYLVTKVTKMQSQKNPLFLRYISVKMKFFEYNNILIDNDLKFALRNPIKIKKSTKNVKKTKSRKCQWKTAC